MNVTIVDYSRGGMESDGKVSVKIQIAGKVPFKGWLGFLSYEDEVLTEGLLVNVGDDEDFYYIVISPYKKGGKSYNVGMEYLKKYNNNKKGVR